MQKNKGKKSHEDSLGDEQNRTRYETFWDFWAPLLLTIGLYAGMRTYIAEARYIPSGSMLPGLKINDRLLIEKLTFRSRTPRRGEIVVFNSPYAFNGKLIEQRSTELPSSLRCAVLNFPLLTSFIGLRDPACDAYIKRVVAVGGDKVFVNSRGEVFLNGLPINEPYPLNYCVKDPDQISGCRPLETTVPFSKVFVLGDNRSNSWDSRFWPGSPFLPQREIIGRAVFRFWPINRIGFLGS